MSAPGRLIIDQFDDLLNNFSVSLLSVGKASECLSDVLLHIHRRKEKQNQRSRIAPFGLSTVFAGIMRTPISV
jgi:hypothetical protein